MILDQGKVPDQWETILTPLSAKGLLQVQALGPQIAIQTLEKQELYSDCQSQVPYGQSMPEIEVFNNH